MKTSARKKMWLFTGCLLAVLGGCAEEQSMPFPAHIEFQQNDAFQFTAKGTWEFPATTSAGERARVSWLSQYLTKEQRCPFGYKIVERTTSGHRTGKHNPEDDDIISITYEGKCLSKDGKDAHAP